MKNNLKAFVQYSEDDYIIPGEVLLRNKKPSSSRWVQIPESLCCSQVTFQTNFRTHGKLKAFVKYSGAGKPLEVVTKPKKPAIGKWIEIPYRQCCVFDVPAV